MKTDIKTASAEHNLRQDHMGTTFYFLSVRRDLMERV